MRYRFFSAYRSSGSWMTARAGAARAQIGGVISIIGPCARGKPGGGSRGFGHLRRVLQNDPVKRAHARTVALRIEDQPVDHLPAERACLKACETGLRGVSDETRARHQQIAEIALDHHRRRAAFGLPVERDEGERRVAQNRDAAATPHGPLDLGWAIGAVARLFRSRDHRVARDDAISVLLHFLRRRPLMWPLEPDRGLLCPCHPGAEAETQNAALQKKSHQYGPEIALGSQRRACHALCQARGLAQNRIKAALLWVSFGAARPKYRSTCARGCNVQIRFDHGPTGAACQFAQAARLIVAHEPDEVPAALAAMDAARAAGHWLAGFASYELGDAFEPRLAATLPAHRRLPLLQFGVFEAPLDAAPLSPGPAQLGEMHPDWDACRYAEAFRTVHDYICAGDIYQANLTFPIRMQATGTPPVRYAALIEADGLPALLSRSPELFFRTDASGGIETRPMKGTQPRSADAMEDARRRFFLQSDEKNRAENLMIVDLL